MGNAAPGHGYAGYRLRAVLLFLFLSGYAVLAFAGDLYSERGEFFPAFSWSLFSRPSDRIAILEVMVYRIDDRTFDPPVRYTSLRDEFGLAQSTDAAKTVRRFVRGMSGPVEEAEARRRVVEARLFEGKPVEYEIRRTQFVPLERYREGTEIDHWVLGRFTTGGGR